MADQAPAPARPLPVNPNTVRDPQSRNVARNKVFFETVQRLLTLALQQAWKRQQDLENPDAPAVRAEDCPIQAMPLEEPPLQPKGWWPTDDTDSYDRILHDITQWVNVRTLHTPALWDSLSGKMHAHCSYLPDGLPGPISRQSQQEMWRRLFPDFRGQSQTTQQHIKIKRCWHFFRKNLQFYATLGLAEKAASTSTAKGTTAATSNDYRKLAAQMEGNPALTLLAEKVATGTANLNECERFYACLPAPTITEPGHTQEIRQMREERGKEKLQGDEWAEHDALMREGSEIADRYFEQGTGCF